MVNFNTFLVAFLVFFTLSLSSTTDANEVIGCGGFIKSNTEINYKIIKVKLLTKERIVKYTTEASPVNGYYMIPVYAKGEYILQVNPPPGWSFEPTEIPVNVDGETDACTKNEDINFFFKGFGLSGKVVTNGDVRMNGPSEIKLNLISNNKIIDSTLSSNDGSYYFSNVMPGAYQIEAQHDSIQFFTNKVSVVLSKENWSAKDNIIVSGYKVEGYVKTTKGDPVSNAIVELFFNDETYSKIDTEKFICDQSSKKNLKTCHTKTDSMGKFSFLNLAYAKYKISANLEMENGLLKFSMHPSSLLVDLTGHKDLILSESFKIEKVTVMGQALLKKDGKPIESGQVYINGEKMTDTIGKDGKFILLLTPGSYKVQAKSDKVHFSENTVELDLSKNSCIDQKSLGYKALQGLTKMVVTAFDVCGQVSVIKDQNINNLYKSIKINAFLSTDTGLKQIKSVNLDEHLQYCMSLNTESHYVLKPELTDKKLSKILKLVPLEKKISTVDRPIMNVNFGQLEAKLEGKLVLLSNPNQEMPNDLVVTIKSEDSTQAWSKNLPVKCEGLVCKFGLTNLLFGDYLITTNYDDLFCWKDQKTVSIDSENQAYQLNQSGFKLNYQLSHKNAVLKVDKQIINVKNSKDLKGLLCLPGAKDYNLIIESCYKYTEVAADTDTVKLSSVLFKKNSNKIILKAVSVQVDFEVLFKNEDSAEVVIKSEDLYIEAVSQDEKTEKISFKLKSKSANELIFAGRGWFVPGQKMRFLAKSSKILFEENTKVLRVSEENCDLNRVKFDAKLGIFITGQIQPNNLENIDLTLRLDNDEKTVLDKSQISAGTFKLGPLKAPHTLYDIELVKNGYLFTKKISNKDKKSSDVVEYEFNAEKLGQLKVNVLNKKLGVQLENVLLSLSSENRQFRQNHKTGSKGETSFENLKPGLYYLIVMMQEYEFEPNSHPVRISDGADVSIKINAERTAYSCLGKVTSINGQPENTVQIEAIGVYNAANSDVDSCAQSQESASVENGLYRIYNLKPKCEYTLKLKNIGNTEMSQNSRVIPETYSFLVGESDVVKQDFVLLDPVVKVDVSLAIGFKPENNPATQLLNHYVKVKLFKMNEPDSVIQTQYTSANSVIYFNQLARNPAQEYSIQLSLLATSAVYSEPLTQSQQNQLSQQTVIESMELDFMTDRPHKHLSARFVLDKKNANYFDQDHRQEQYQNVYMTLPLFVVIIGVLLSLSSVQKQLTNLRSYIENGGGVIKIAQSFQSRQSPTSPKSPRSNRNKTHLNRGGKGLSSDSSANESDLERSTKYATRQNTPIPNYNKAEITDNYEIINNEDVLDMQLSNKKQRVKKID